jgi:hypothetical protein
MARNDMNLNLDGGTGRRLRMMDLTLSDTGRLL